MIKATSILASASVAVLSGFCLFAVSALSATPSYISEAIDYSGRPPPDIDRDAARKPAEVLAFAGVKPGEAVADHMPGNAYYTRLLSKVVGPKGNVYAFVPQIGPLPPAIRRDNQQKGLMAPPRADNAVLQLSDVHEYSNVMAIWENIIAFGGQFGVPKQLDLVFTADAYHDLHSAAYSAPIATGGAAAADPVSEAKAVFRALKSGGTYVIIDYAAAKGAGFTQADSLHRVDPDAVKAEMTAAGFVLDGESQALANPNDDHTKDALDPSMRDNADQFMLRFKKPANSPNTDKRNTVGWFKKYYGNTYEFGGSYLFFQPNGSYQEFSKPAAGFTAGYCSPDTKICDNFREGWIYWDADARGCAVRQYPIDMRPLVICFELVPLDVGQVAQLTNGGNTVPRPATLVAGHVYPK